MPADLSYGRIEGGGLRCLYHRWKCNLPCRRTQPLDHEARAQGHTPATDYHPRRNQANR